MFSIYLFIIAIIYLNYANAWLGTKTHTSRKSISPLQMNGKTPLVANGKRVEADPGSSLMAACLKLGLKVPTDCKKGQCGTCTVSVGGNKIRACIGKVPPAPKLKSLIEKGLAVAVDN